MDNAIDKSRKPKYAPSPRDEARIEELGNITGIGNDAEVCTFALHLLRSLLDSDQYAGKVAIKFLDGHWQVAPTLEVESRS